MPFTKLSVIVPVLSNKSKKQKQQRHLLKVKQNSKATQLLYVKKNNSLNHCQLRNRSLCSEEKHLQALRCLQNSLITSEPCLKKKKKDKIKTSEETLIIKEMLLNIRSVNQSQKPLLRTLCQICGTYLPNSCT